MIISKTPLRISLLGGGTDLPAFYEKSPGAVISMAINRYVYIAVNEKFDNRFRVSYSITENVEAVDEIRNSIVRHTLNHFKVKSGLEIISIADVPGEGTGLGSSSAFTVGLINALDWHFDHDYRSHGVLAETAFQIERGVHPDIGRQDAYASAYGGFNYLRFHKTHVSVQPLEMPNEMFSWFLLLYTGVTRQSDLLLNTQREGFEKDKEKVAIGKEMAGLANEFYRCFNIDLNVGPFLHENWKLKRALHDGISTPQIDAWYECAMQNGALGGKLCGAGGGGFLLFYAPPDAHARIAEATGLRRVDFDIEPEGSKVVYG